MKLVSYIKESHEQLALMMGDTLYDMDVLHPELPSTMSMFLNYWQDYYPLAKAVNESIEEGKISFNKGIPLSSVHLISPVPWAAACMGVFGGSTNLPPNQGLMAQQPDFYFNNHHLVQGPGDVHCMPGHVTKLDFEPGIAIVVCAHARNIPAAEADTYIGGFMIRNSITTRSRTISNREGNHSYAKGKDVGIVLGPVLITPDELSSFLVPAKEGHTGNTYDLSIKCRVNKELVCESNMAEMNWTFAEILESCSYGADLQPGDIISNATSMGGCLSDLNATARETDPGYTDRWLQPGDIVEVEIDQLGLSSSTISLDNDSD